MVITIDITELESVERYFRDIPKVYARIVRNTLNDLAFDMKGRKGQPGTIEARSRTEFDHRRAKTFIRAMSGARRAKGNNISKMYSVAGIFERPGRTKVAEGLAKQEFAEDVKHEFTPLNKARVGDNEARRVKGKAQHSKMPDYIDVTNAEGAQKMKLLIFAAKRKTPVLVRGRRNKRDYIAVPTGKLKKFSSGGRTRNKMARNARRGKTQNTRVELNFLYARNKGGIARLKKKRPFVMLAGKDTMKKFNVYFNYEVGKEVRNLMFRR